MQRAFESVRDTACDERIVTEFNISYDRRRRACGRNDIFAFRVQREVEAIAMGRRFVRRGGDDIVVIMRGENGY